MGRIISVANEVKRYLLPTKEFDGAPVPQAENCGVGSLVDCPPHSEVVYECELQCSEMTV